MASLFQFMLEFMRRRGSTMGGDELRALWLIITLIYAATALVMVTAAISMSLRRAWLQAIAERPRRSRKSVSLHGEG